MFIYHKLIKEMKTCLSCNSNKIIEGLKIIEYAYGNAPRNLSIDLQTTHRAFFNKFLNSDISAQVCCGCGKVELSVENLDAIWNAHLKQKI